MNKLLKEKIKEAIRAVLPLTIVIIAVLSILENDNKVNDIVMFSIGSLLLMIGLVIFNIGAVHSMMDLSKEIGAYITKKRKIWLLVLVGAVIGLLITVSEPSVWVLGQQFETFVNKYLLIFAISIGVAVFLVLALLRLILKMKLNVLLLIFLAILFALAGAAELLGASNFVPVAFDSGGVTTGPMAVPFIISLGLGVLSTGASKDNNDESFGMVGIASIGPIMAVLVLGLASFNRMQVTTVEAEAVLGFMDYVLEYLKDMGIAILPFVFFFAVFQIFAFKFPKERVVKIMIGFFMTYLGLVIFLVGASVGFMNIGRHLGEVIAGFDKQWLLIVFGVIFGFVIVAAEPSVVVLVGQVQEVTDDRVSKKIMLIAMSVGVSLAVGLAMVRIVYDVSIWYFIVPGYLISIALSFIVPKLFTGIAFDSGGAVSGALTSTFLVPFALGAAGIIYPGSTDKLLTNAFGLVAFVAMAPLITIQVVGLIFKIKQKGLMDESKEKDVIIDVDDEVIDLDYGRPKEPEKATHSIDEGNTLDLDCPPPKATKEKPDIIENGETRLDYVPQETVEEAETTGKENPHLAYASQETVEETEDIEVEKIHLDYVTPGKNEELAVIENGETRLDYVPQETVEEAETTGKENPHLAYASQETVEETEDIEVEKIHLDYVTPGKNEELAVIENKEPNLDYPPLEAIEEKEETNLDYALPKTIKESEVIENGESNLNYSSRKASEKTVSDDIDVNINVDDEE